MAEDVLDNYFAANLPRRSGGVTSNFKLIGARVIKQAFSHAPSVHLYGS